MCGASRVPPPGDLAHNPGMCPDWELNRRPFGSQAGAQSTESHHPGPARLYSHVQTGLANLSWVAGLRGSASDCRSAGLGFKMQVEFAFVQCVTY